MQFFDCDDVDLVEMIQLMVVICVDDMVMIVDGGSLMSVVYEVVVLGFELCDVFGEGGMGVVYFVYQCEFGCYVVIKILCGEFVGQCDECCSFFVELCVMGVLQYLNVVLIYFVFEMENGEIWFVMKWIEGCFFGELFVVEL